MIKYKTRMLILEVLESYSARNGNKSYKLETEVKLSLFADDMILSIENPKESKRIYKTSNWSDEPFAKTSCCCRRSPPGRGDRSCRAQQGGGSAVGPWGRPGRAPVAPGLEPATKRGPQCPDRSEFCPWPVGLEEDPEPGHCLSFSLGGLKLLPVTRRQRLCAVFKLLHLWSFITRERKLRC